MATNGNDFYIKITSASFICDLCDFTCSKKGDWNRHINTRKHKSQHLSTDFTSKLHQTFICSNCNKQFNDRSGLWRHKKVCIKNDEKTVSNSTSSDKNDKLIDFLMKENKEIKEMILEIVKNGITNNNNSHNTNNTHTNSHNKAFNLNFFLNETCKNAMNIIRIIFIRF